MEEPHLERTVSGDYLEKTLALMLASSSLLYSLFV